MTPELAVDLIKGLMLTALMLAAPILGIGMMVGLMVSLFQAVTSIHEQTLAFVPKAVAIVAAFILLMPWMMQMAIEFTMAMFGRIPDMVR
jgi:flagellar biosynthetic protein FliQ